MHAFNTLLNVPRLQYEMKEERQNTCCRLPNVFAYSIPDLSLSAANQNAKLICKCFVSRAQKARYAPCSQVIYRHLRLYPASCKNLNLSDVSLKNRLHLSVILRPCASSCALIGDRRWWRRSKNVEINQSCVSSIKAVPQPVLLRRV